MIDWTLMQSPAACAAAVLAAQKAAIAARRNAAMPAGIAVAGLPIATDDVSHARITGAALAALEVSPFAGIIQCIHKITRV